MCPFQGVMVKASKETEPFLGCSVAALFSPSVRVRISQTFAGKVEVVVRIRTERPILGWCQKYQRCLFPGEGLNSSELFPVYITGMVTVSTHLLR